MNMKFYALLALFTGAASALPSLGMRFGFDIIVVSYTHMSAGPRTGLKYYDGETKVELSAECQKNPDGATCGELLQF